MTIIAKRSVQLKKHIYSKGESVEWDGPIDSRIAANFVTKDGKELQVTSANGEKDKGANSDGGKPANGEKDKGQAGEEGVKGTPGDAGTPKGKVIRERIDKLVKEIGRKGIEQKLDELGVTYRAKMNDSQLALLLLQQQGEV